MSRDLLLLQAFISDMRAALDTVYCRPPRENLPQLQSEVLKFENIARDYIRVPSGSKSGSLRLHS